MDKQFHILRQTRTNILNAISELTDDQLNKIPKGFNNNIIWNVAHCLVTNQSLTYHLSGNQPKLPKEFILKYRKGTMVESPCSEQEITEIKSLLISSVDTIENDYNNNLLGPYFKEYTTSYGVTISSLEEAINFANVHEGLHFGYILAQKKLV